MRSAFTVCAFLGLLLVAFSFILPRQRLSTLSLNAYDFSEDYPLAKDVVRYDVVEIDVVSLRERPGIHFKRWPNVRLYENHKGELKEMLDVFEKAARYETVELLPFQPYFTQPYFTSTLTVPPIRGFEGASIAGHTLLSKKQAEQSAAVEFLRIHWTTLKVALDEDEDEEDFTDDWWRNQ
jgi:hypothetical protein